MISRHSIILRSSLVLAAGIIVSLLLGKKTLLPGFILGMVLGTANFLFLELSVSSIFKTVPADSNKNLTTKLVTGYFLKAVVKFTILGLMVFVFVKYFNVDWMGLIAGFFATIILFFSEILRAKKCQ